jgi:thiazole synthase ThiGH ThiG subunit
MEVIQTRDGVTRRSVASTRAADSKNKAELRKSIEASTARLVTIAMTRDPDLDPEAA